jgi:co-chaperonin GroES (HSP10)
MQPRGLAKKLVVTPLGEYAPAEWGGENSSGIQPIGDRVLILPDGAAEKTLVFTEETKERMAMAAETGVLVAVGESAWAWNSDRTRPFTGTKPVEGQRVWFERYAGSVQHGEDGRLYRLLDDKCVGAIALK